MKKNYLLAEYRVRKKLSRVYVRIHLICELIKLDQDVIITAQCVTPIHEALYFAYQYKEHLQMELNYENKI